jgi:hypothetical protein
MRRGTGIAFGLMCAFIATRTADTSTSNREASSLQTTRPQTSGPRTEGTHTTLVGRILDEGRHPVPATVVVHSEPSSSGALLPPSEVETDSDGHFNADAHRGTVVVRVIVGSIRVDRPPMRLATGTTDVGDIIVDVGASVQGVIRRAANGAYIHNAAVIARPSPGAGSRENVEVRSLKDGRFIIPRLMARDYDIDISAKGMVRAHYRLQPSEATVAVSLDDESRLVGKVVGADDRPIVSDARITATLVGEGREWQDNPDAKGRFTIEHLSAGVYAIAVDATDSVPVSRPNIVVAPGETVDLGTLRLASGATIIGTVHDSSGGPIDGAVISARFHEGEKESLRTASNGRFRLSGIPAGETIITVQHNRYATVTRTVSIGPGPDPSELEIEMAAGGTLIGTITTGDGLPVGGAKLLLSRAERTFDDAWPRGMVSLADGTFRFENVTPGPWILRLPLHAANSDASGSLAKDVDVLDGKTVRVLIVITVVRVSGTVTSEGVPVPGAVVKITPVDQAYDEATSNQTDSSGKYSMVVVGSGVMNAQVAYADGQTALGMLSEINIDPAERERVLDLEIGGDAVLTGAVQDADSRLPLSGANVGLWPETGVGVRATAITDANGLFRMRVPRQGEYHMRVFADDYAARFDEIDVGKTHELVVRLTRGRALEGNVVSPDRSPVEGVLILATELASPGRGIAGSAVSAANGSFKIRNLRPVPHSLYARTDLGESGIVRNVTPDNDDVPLLVKPGGRVELTVIGPDGAGRRRSSIEIVSVDGIPVHTSEFIYSDGLGRAILAVPSGTIELAIRDGRNESRETVRVDAEGVVKVTATVGRR